MLSPKQDVKDRIESLESQLKDALARIEALESAQASAQNVTFGEITCRNLRVINEKGYAGVILRTDENGGVVRAYGKPGGRASGVYGAFSK